MGFNDRFDKLVLDLMEGKPKTRVIYPNKNKIEAPHMPPRNQPVDGVSKPVGPVTEDIGAAEAVDLDGLLKDVPAPKTNDVPVPASDEQTKLSDNPEAMPDPMPPADGIEEQTTNAPKTEVDKQVESMTALTGVIKDLQAIVGPSNNKWKELTDEIGLNDDRIGDIKIKDKDGSEMTLKEMWDNLGVFLSTTIEALGNINDLIASYRRNEDVSKAVPDTTPPQKTEPQEKQEPQIDIGSADTDINAIADEVPDQI